MALRCGIVLVALIALGVGSAAAAAAEPTPSAPAPAEPVAIAPAEACPEVSRAVARLAAAEHQQSLALDLYAHPDAGSAPRRGALPAVEVGLAEMLSRIQDLRNTLARVRSAPGASRDPMVRECLEVGGAALKQGERVSSEVERVVVEAPGYPPAESPPEGIRSGAPVARSSPRSVSPPAPPGAAAR